MDIKDEVQLESQLTNASPIRIKHEIITVDSSPYEVNYYYIILSSFLILFL